MTNKYDLISRSALKEAFETLFYNDVDDMERTQRLIDSIPAIEDTPVYRFYKQAYERGKAEARPQGDIIDIIKSITDDISIKKDVNGYRPIKNTSKDSCYKALFEIIELLRNSGNIGGEEDV